MVGSSSICPETAGGWLKNILPTTKGICKKAIVSFVHYIKHIIVPIRFVILGSQSDRRILPRTGNILHFLHKSDRSVPYFDAHPMPLTRSADHWDCKSRLPPIGIPVICAAAENGTSSPARFYKFQYLVQQ